MGQPSIQRGANGEALGVTMPPPQVTPEALQALMRLLTGQQPQQRQVELLRNGGRIAGARVTEPGGQVRHFTFDRGADGRLAAARPMAGMP